MTTFLISKFPKPIVAFGRGFSRADFEKLQENIGFINTIAASVSQGLKYGEEFVPNLQASAVLAGQFASVMSVLATLLGKVDKLYQELKLLEKKIFNLILEGKLQALKRNLKNLQDPGTSDVQKVAEIVNAVSQFDEILPLFASEGSIFRERYYQGAPLFVPLCAMLKAISLIAEHTRDYNSGNLQDLKQEYNKVLEWYKVRCIGRRMASCYIENVRDVSGLNWSHDWTRHYEKYKEYYEENPFLPWRKYGEYLGGNGWRVSYGWRYDYNLFGNLMLVDTWDNRPQEEVEFEPFRVGNTSRRCNVWKLCTEVLAEYRGRVETVMAQFFDDVSLIN